MTRIAYTEGLYKHGYFKRYDNGLHVVTYDKTEATLFESPEAAIIYLSTYHQSFDNISLEDTDDDSCNGLTLSVARVKARIADLDKKLRKLSSSTRLGREQRAIAEHERSFLQNNLDAHNENISARLLK